MKQMDGIWGKRAIMIVAGLFLVGSIMGKGEVVKADVVPTVPVQPTMVVPSVFLNTTYLEMTPATTQNLILNGAYGEVEWFSDDEDVATVNASGKVTARGKGVAQIIATHEGVDYPCQVNVVYGTYATSDGMEYKDTKGTFGYTGRWFKKSVSGGKYQFTNTDGSAIYFKVTGSKYVQVDFVSRTTVATPYFAYSVDGGKMKRQSISNKKISVGNKQTHYVRLLLDGMSQDENRWRYEAGIGIKNIKPVTKSGVISAVKPENPVIAFYGDSITQGIRAINRSLSADGTSATNTYAWHCADALDMVPYYAGYGGDGIVKTGSFQNCYNSILYFSAGRKATKIDPAVVVIEHGTNDKYVPSEPFLEGYKKVLKLLHKKYPNAQIMAMVPFTQDHAGDIREAVNSVGDWCTVVETSSWKISYTDGLHPNTSGAKTAGKKLAKKILATRKAK